MRKAILTTCLCALVSFSAMAQTPTLSIEGGKVKGVMTENSQAVVYKGIPYAAPPVGELRWKKPQPVKPWSGVKTCDRFGAVSLQNKQPKGGFYWKEFYQDEKLDYSEDCLYLNVWTPKNIKNKHYPVMVWIHGGAYMNGYGHEIEFDGEKYAQKGVILVTLNYRLGMCGFLSHPLLTAENGGKGSGNYGIYDQLEALKWVKKNIAKFGGDAANVTVFGQSAGAGSVQALISSPLSKGYINRAIIQSGGGLGGIIATASQADYEKKGKEIWDEAGTKTLEEMRAYPADKFGEILAKYQKKQTTFTGLPYNTCVDNELLPGTFDEIAKAGKQLDITYMIGYTSEDLFPQGMKKAAEDWSLLLEKQGRKPAYVYCFNRDLPGEDMPAEAGGMKGAFHSSELWYTFGTLGRCWRPMEKADYELSDLMVSYWTNFAKYGNPNAKGLPEWKTYTAATPYIQELNEKTVGK